MTLTSNVKYGEIDFHLVFTDGSDLLSELVDVIGRPEMGNPWEAFSHVGGQVKAQLVQKQDKGLGL